MNKKYIEAKQRVKMLKRFYIHLFLFLILNIALLFRLLMLEKDESLNFFVWVVLNIMIIWSIGILIHAWIVFKGRLIFSKEYEDRKIEELMRENKTH
ncbi:MAG: 2TM domain-containing protein [Flavobacteriaceae bacterium]